MTNQFTAFLQDLIFLGGLIKEYKQSGNIEGLRKSEIELDNLVSTAKMSGIDFILIQKLLNENLAS